VLSGFLYLNHVKNIKLILVSIRPHIPVLGIGDSSQACPVCPYMVDTGCPLDEKLLGL